MSANEVWLALNDPAVLKQCLPGCELFEQAGNNTFKVALIAKVGPVKAKFNGELALEDVNPPISYRISGAGQGGVAGFVKGGANVRLEPTDEDTATLITYEVSASVGGKLAQIGSRLVMGAARKMANEFFAGFVRLLSGDETMDVQLETLKT